MSAIGKLRQNDIFNLGHEKAGSAVGRPFAGVAHPVADAENIAWPQAASSTGEPVDASNASFKFSRFNP